MSLKYRASLLNRNSPLIRPRARRSRMPMEMPHERLRAWGVTFLALVALVSYVVLTISPSDYNNSDTDYFVWISMCVCVVTRSFFALLGGCFSKSTQNFFKHPLFILLRALADFGLMSGCIYGIVVFAANQ